MSIEKVKIFLFTMVLALSAGISTESRANLAISDAPMFVSVSVDPNIMFTFDDSGSMQWEIMPEDVTFWSHMYPRPSGMYGPVVYGERIPWFGDDLAWNLRLRSFATGGGSRENALSYNPYRDYKPWVKADASEFDPADPEDALYNPGAPAFGGMDLTERMWHRYWWDNGNRNDWRQFWPITFYMYKGSGSVNSANSYVKYQIRGSDAYVADPADSSLRSISSFDWPDGPTRSVIEERQNFANWFSFYRSRALLARAGIGRAFAALPSNARVGFGAINQGSTRIDGVNTRTVIDGVRRFSGDDRESFYDRLYERDLTGITPMRSAAVGIGEYFERTDSRGPWSTTPGDSGGSNLECRQSFHILMSDGSWNGSSPDVGNADGVGTTSHTGPEGQAGGYAPSDPFQDDRSNTLADVAMYYWKRDLQSDLANRVPTNEADPAFWQHLTTFGVGLGVTGDLDPDEVAQALLEGNSVEWGNPFNSSSAKIDDLLHFGINGRGGFFSAADPDSFAEKLGDVLREIVARSAATTGVSVSATRLSTESLVYAAEFDSDDWSGELTAIDSMEGTVEYRASEELEGIGHAARKIFTFAPEAGEAEGDGIRFQPSSMAAISDRLDVEGNVPDNDLWTLGNIVNYVRGDDENEGEAAFRVRSSMLGDIVNSRPLFSGAGNEGWGRVDDDYLDYVGEDKNDPRDCPEEEGSCQYEREDTVFVGGNDGMLHAFDARNLKEYFAYVPSAVHHNLWRLADPEYNHKFYVDGQVAVGDAKLGSSWGTYLVGTLGAGGRGVYALDVTDPKNFSEDDVLWELTAEDDPDIGFTYGEPLITRLEDGTWVTIFGNGYNSQDDRAYLFVVDLADGEILQKIVAGDSGANGLSGVAGWRDPVERTHIRRVYAGDLEGTMWRFDFEDSEGSLAFDDGLFEGDRPITSSPSLAAHPSGGLMVYYGTGKFIEGTDKVDTSVERFYGIRDRNSDVSENQLSEVTMQASPSVGDEPPQRTLQGGGDGVGGWFVDLRVGEDRGEKVLVKPQLGFAGRVNFSTFEPVDDPCTPGGIQRTYLLNSLTGGGRSIEIGSGAPISPPIAIKPPIGGPSIGDIPFPGNPDPGDPGDPDYPPAPDPTDGDPEGWCSEIGIPPLFEGGEFLSLGQICEGRQVWREIR